MNNALHVCDKYMWVKYMMSFYSLSVRAQVLGGVILCH